MGLVDYITIRSKLLPAGIDEKYIDWQTKSFACSEEWYYIDKNGILIYEPEVDSMNRYPYTGEIRMRKGNFEIVAWCVNGYVKEIINLND